MATVRAKTATFESIQVGDDLPILVKHESQESIDQYSRYALTGPRPGWSNLHTDKSFADQGIFGGTVNMGVATVAYVAELLEKAFQVRDLMSSGSKLEIRATEPVRVGDTITLTGQVTSKQEEAGQLLVDCEVVGTNQHEQVVARAKARIPLAS